MTRDTWISSVGEERFGNNGGAKRLKFKGQQEYSLLDIDPSPLKGKLITGALLHIRSASPRKAVLGRIGVSTVAGRWVEGNSTDYRPESGASCFDQAEYRKRDWSYPGSTVMDVTFGRGRSIWKFVDCAPPDDRGWQACAVDPDVIAARVAGLSYGFFIQDEMGSAWSLKKGKFDYAWFPNLFSYSRESGESAPWLEVWLHGDDSIPPEPLHALDVDVAGFPGGEALVRWKTPEDRGGGKTMGFHVTYERGNLVSEMPRYLVPMAAGSGEEVRMHIRDLPFRPGESVGLTIQPVDSAGNIGPPFTRRIQLSSSPHRFDIPEADITPFARDRDLPTLGGLKVAVVDLLDKIDPKTGKMIPLHPEDYKGGNHLYSAKRRLVRLQSARNEVVTFQLILEGQAKRVSVKYIFGQNPRLKAKVFQSAYVNVVDKGGQAVSVLPDPLIPLEGTFSIPSTAGQMQVPGQMNHSLICELYVPHDEPAGKKRGKLVITVNGETMDLEVALKVWDFTLPDKLSFIPEMNSYSTVSPYQGYEYYRLAHEHRTCINRLPYGWHGRPSFAPEWDGNDFDWSQWDKKVGPLLDGTAFQDLPRKGQPVDVFYLPFNENWPIGLFEHYTPSYWADESFTAQYREGLKRAFLFARTRI